MRRVDDFPSIYTNRRKIKIEVTLMTFNKRGSKQEEHPGLRLTKSILKHRDKRYQKTDENLNFS